LIKNKKVCDQSINYWPRRLSLGLSFFMLME
jgi:hypothetical protein